MNPDPGEIRLCARREPRLREALASRVEPPPVAPAGAAEVGTRPGPSGVSVDRGEVPR